MMPSEDAWFNKIGNLRTKHRLAARDMNFLCPQFGKLGDGFFKAFGADGRLACIPPVIAHLALEIAPVKDLDLYIQRLERTCVQNRLF